MKIASVLILMAALASVSFSIAAENAVPASIPAVSKPSQDVTLSFTRPGRITELLVKDGDEVTAGQLVAKQDDTEEQAALDFKVEKAKDNTRTLAQVAVRDHKKQVYENKKNSGNAANATEISEALLDWKVGDANVALSEFDHAQDGREAAQARAALEKTRLKTSIAGRVEQTWVKAGESVDAQSMKVMRVVNINPLWIDVPTPFSLARNVKNGATATVTFSNGEKREAKVIHVASVADAASDTLLVRVEVENKAQTPAGERVSVGFAGATKVAATP